MRHRSPDPGSEGPAHERALAFVGSEGGTQTVDRGPVWFFKGRDRRSHRRPRQAAEDSRSGRKHGLPAAATADLEGQSQASEVSSPPRPRPDTAGQVRTLRHSPQAAARCRGCTDRGVDTRSFTCRLAAPAARRRLTRAWARESRRRVGAGRAQGPRRRSKAPPLQEAERATARGSRAPGCVSCSP